MVIITMLSYPSESSKEIGKRFLELPPLPSYLTRKGPYIGSELGVGIRSVSLYEFDQSKMAEAMEFVTSNIAKFFGVPGFTHSTNVFLEAKQALKMIGLG